MISKQASGDVTKLIILDQLKRADLGRAKQWPGMVIISEKKLKEWGKFGQVGNPKSS